MKKLIVLVILTFAIGCFSGCEYDATSDEVQREQQEMILKEGTNAVGMPAIKNFRERRLLKEIIELRDQDGLVTYTYLISEMTGKLVYFGETIGYGIPYATQFTNPEKFDRQWIDGSATENYVEGVIKQADPNGLYSPDSAEGTWVLLKDPNSGDVKPVYVEPRIVVSPFKLNI